MPRGAGGEGSGERLYWVQIASKRVLLSGCEGLACHSTCRCGYFVFVGGRCEQGGQMYNYNKCFEPWAAAGAGDRGRMVGEGKSKTGNPFRDTTITRASQRSLEQQLLDPTTPSNSSVGNGRVRGFPSTKTSEAGMFSSSQRVHVAYKAAALNGY